MSATKPINCGTGHCSCIECVWEGKPPMRVLGYVRKEVLDLCRHAENTSSLTVVPVAPKAGNWVPIFFEGESEC